MESRDCLELLRKVDQLLRCGDLESASLLVERLDSDPAVLMDPFWSEIKCYYQGCIFAHRGMYAEALELGKRSLERFWGHGLRFWVGRCHLLLSSAYLGLGRYAYARRHAEAAVHYYTWEVDEPGQKVTALKLLSWSLKNLGDWRGAEEALREAIDESGSGGEGVPLRLNLGILLRKVGKVDEAARVVSEGLDLACGVGDDLRRCLCLLELGNISVVKRDVEGGLRYVREAREVAERHGYRRERVLAREIEGDIAFLSGDYDDALRCYEDGLREAREFASGGDLEYELLSRLSRVHVKLGRLDEARREAERAVELTERCGDRYEHALGLRALGEVEVAEGRVGSGIEYLRSGVRELRGLSDWTPELGDTELELGRLLCERGEGVEGLEHLFIARRVYTNLGFGEGVREVDGVIAGLVSVPRLGLRGVARASRGYYGELSRYGIVTVDERIVGDVSRWGPSEMRVLIEGETGVGKELIARAMHAMSARCEEPFIVIDCAGLAESVVESELFGHSKGSFTGADKERRGLIEDADGGTLFLDEVGELSERMQLKLLRVLEEGCVSRVGSNEARRVDFRVISATTRDLVREVEGGRFRRDLYYRLKGVLIRVPSLRERPYDVRLLLEYYLGVFNDRYGKSVSLSEEVVERLMSYDWPGNVRELRNLVEALVVSSVDGAVVKEADVARLLDEPGFSADVDGSRLSRGEIENALRYAGGNKTRAARLLGISRQTLWRKLRSN